MSAAVALRGTGDTTAAQPGDRGTAALLRYGALGLPLAFVALPLYVQWPTHYAQQFGVPLAALGALLLAARALDALIDPWIGRWADRLFARSSRRVLAACGAAALLVALGFIALFFPPDAVAQAGSGALLAWGGASLVVTYLGYSVAQVLHQAWGAMLGGDAPTRARVVASREGPALVGVLLASALPGLAGLPATTGVLIVLLGLGWLALRSAPAPEASTASLVTTAAAHNGHTAALATPWQLPAFRRLIAVFVLNGMASAVPATLVLFFIRDRLQAGAAEPLFLTLYFAAAACSVPLWVRVVRRLGLVRAWAAGMALAVATFAWTATLGAGDVAAFAVVCAASGLALGADLTIPAALLAGVVQVSGRQGAAEGAFFGWWNFATKLNLALAAGLALPALQWLGYAPGARDADALQSLSLAYGVLPCVVKALACVALLAWASHWREAPAARSTSEPKDS